MAEQASTIRKVWSGPGRAKVEKVFRTDLLAADPALCESFLTKLDGLVRAGTPEDAIYRELRRFYESHEARFIHCNEIHKSGRAKRRMEQIGQAVPEEVRPAKILDVGCGNGLITSGLSALFNVAAEHVFGLDPFEPENPSDKFRYLAYDANGDIPVPPQTFNVVMALMVFHHAPDHLKLLAEVHRVLADDGVFIVRETDAASDDDVAFNTMMDRIFYGVFDRNDALSENFNFRSAADWRKTFEDAGFEVLKLDRSESGEAYSPTWFVLGKRKAPATPSP